MLPVCAKWYDFGLELDITSDTLDNIKSTFQENSERLRECVKIFLKQSSPMPTWEIIVKALAEPNVGYADLAMKLKGEYVEKSRDPSRLAVSEEGMTNVKGLIKLIIYPKPGDNWFV